MARIYFDWAASAPFTTDTFRPHNPVYSLFGNPSSMHLEGRNAKAALQAARERCAQVLGLPAERIYFTSGGTESNQLVLDSLLFKAKPTIAISRIEHSSISAKVEMMIRFGFPVVWIAPESDGRIDPDRVEKTTTKSEAIRFMACMAVNNETGANMDISGIVQAARRGARGPLHFHCDAVQAIGKVPFPAQATNIDSISLSAHKLGGPKGIGLLYLRQPLESWNRGGGQEGGIRSGTENVWGATMLAESLEFQLEPSRLETDRREAQARFAELIGFIKRSARCSTVPYGRDEVDPRFSPYILQMAIRDIPGETLVRVLDDMGIAISTGSACSSSIRDRPVLKAMGIDDKTAFEAVRISQGRMTKMAEIDSLIAALTTVMKRL